jgi:hypothetical protein
MRGLPPRPLPFNLRSATGLSSKGQAICADELMRTGSFDVFGGETMSHQDANALMVRRA